MVRSRYARGAVKVRMWCGQGTLVVQSRNTCVLPVRGSGAVQHFNFLSGGIL